MSTTNNGAGLAHEYIVKLERDWLCAEYHHTEAAALAQRASDEYLVMSALRASIRGYKEKAEATRALMQSLKRYIQSFISHLDEVLLRILDASVGAVKILLKSLKCLSFQVEDTRRQLRALLAMIDCLNNPVLSRDTSIMKCLADLLAKTEASVAANLAAIKSVLALLRQIIDLQYNHFHSNRNHIDFGIKADLARFLHILDCNACQDNAHLYRENELCPEPDSGDGPQCPVVAESFPVITPFKSSLCDENGSYQVQLADWLLIAEDHTRYTGCLKELYEEKKKNAKLALDAIKSALDAAKAVKAKCK
ncbi:MAG: hypothetical protein KF852_03280 [Saprospiraceae bacterium]|nr:hypothetical protein [Saprospiraceae bacterium]